MYPETQREAVQRLERDYKFKKITETHMRGGHCPTCKKKELWTFTQEPWVLFCPRKNECGEEFHIRDLYPDLFENWEKRFKPTEKNPTATVDAYLAEGRGFPIDQLKGLYSQEYYKNSDLNVGSVTIRFSITDDPDNVGWWQRILDDHGVLPKTTFRPKWESREHGWVPPATNLIESKEIWITEGIFDTIALWQSGITSISALTSYNYPGIILDKIARECDEKGIDRPKLVWAYDNDPAGHDGTLKFIARAKAEGWACSAAQPPFSRKKVDWNDLYKQERLGFHDLDNYKYYGALLIAERPVDKALLIYNRTGKTSFPFDHGKCMYWFKLDMDKLSEEMKGFYPDDNKDWLEEEKEEARKKYRDNALKNCNTVVELMDCKPQALYWQCNEETDEQWYYFRIDFPRNKQPVKNTFTGGQLAAASEFKKRLLSIAPGVVYTGSGTQLDYLLKHWTRDIKRVQLINYVGYNAALQTYVLGDIAVQNGKKFKINKEDYFELPRNINLKAQVPFDLTINTQAVEYKPKWIDDLIGAYQVKGLIALTAFFGSMFSQQICKLHKSFTFVEIVGEPGTGKSTLLYFLWRLMGRDNYEGEDPNKTSKSGLLRTFRQVSNLPVVLIESDRKGEHASKQFNWDHIKTLYDQGSLGALGVKNNGNETYNPPFMGTIIISQNAEIVASEAIMGRLVHIGFKKDQLTKQTLEASRRLNKYTLEDVSYFIIECLLREKEILDTYTQRMEYHDHHLHQDHLNIQSSRVIHNHAQLMALFDALTEHVIKVDPNICSEVIEQLTVMAQERDKILLVDPPIVQNFWDAFEQIENTKSLSEDSVVNHHSKRHLVAINFAQLYKVAADLRFNLPDMQTLQDALRHSQYYKFVEANRNVSSVIQKQSVRCWIFEKPTSARD
ncbi:toprim domain-containing protein [Acinetobacter sp. VNK23]|uniref:toprim domain-containing protein n=1 Tax=Acinetobacter thutiue TaxID=2998078 RepID=UPI00257654E3|nr:toprim domain-containing protein [Acinetobacter thutiue]MDM1022099.1 toprim domain-containing protein [Acinetobacter thutiue]